MIEYEYKCTCCQHQLCTKQSIKEKPLKQCPACSQFKLERVIFGGMEPIIRGEATTIGQLAERNSKKMGKELVAKKQAQHKAQGKAAKQRIKQEAAAKGINVTTPSEDRKTPIYGNVDHNRINKMTPKEKERYILEGK